MAVWPNLPKHCSTISLLLKAAAGSDTYPPRLNSMIRCFLTGIREATANWKMVLLLLVANILFAIPLVVPVLLLFTRTTGGTIMSQRLYADNLDAIWFSDFMNERFVGGSPVSFGLLLFVMLFVVGGVYLLVNTLFAGGAIEVFTSQNRRFTMRKFWGGCGAYFGRFVRLTLISLIFYMIAFGFYLLLVWRISESNTTATVETPTTIKAFAALLLFLLLASVVNMVFDYARIGAVINDRRKMFRETFKAARFAFRNFLSVFGLYALLSIIGLILFALLLWFRGLVHQTSLGTILLAAVIGQTAMATRMWVRMAHYAAQVEMYQSFALKTAAVTKPASNGEASASPELSTPQSEESIPIRAKCLE